MIKLSAVISSIFILLLGYFTFNIINFLEVFKKLKSQNNSFCKVIRGAVGIEDLVFYGDKFIIGGSDDRGKLWFNKNYKNKKSPNGKMIIIEYLGKDLDNIEILELPILNFPSEINFHPHGIYLYKNKYIYVINHAYQKGGERVELFEIINPHDDIKSIHLNYTRSIFFEKSYAGSLNDLVVIGDNDEMIITTWLPYADNLETGHDSSITSKIIRLALIGLNIKLTNVYHCIGCGENCKIIPNSQSLMNNGITYDYKDLLYVAQPIERRIRVFKIMKNTPTNVEFKFVKDIDLGYAVDNVEFNKDTNSITAGIIGKVYGFFNIVGKYSKSGNLNEIKEYGGAMAIQIKTESTEISRLITLQNDMFIGISSSVIKDDLVFHGSWIDDGVLICKIK